ncbi:Yif1 family protein, partial [Kipferlia bialata]
QAPPPQQALTHLPPAVDAASPDLYVPLMALVTWIMVVGLSTALRGEFQPRVFTSTLSKGLLFCLLEVALVRGGLYMMKYQGIRWLDLLAYSLYLFIPCGLASLVGVVKGLSALYWPILVYLAVSQAVFVAKTARSVLSGELTKVINGDGYTQANEQGGGFSSLPMGKGSDAEVRH